VVALKPIGAGTKNTAQVVSVSSVERNFGSIMREKVSILIAGFGGVVPIGIAVWGAIEASKSYSQGVMDYLFVALLVVFGVSVIYTSYLAWNSVVKSNVQQDDDSLVKLQLRKKRLTLEKEIRELEAAQANHEGRNT
jgi:hypothetical protein